MIGSYLHEFLKIPRNEIHHYLYHIQSSNHQKKENTKISIEIEFQLILVDSVMIINICNQDQS